VCSGWCLFSSGAAQLFQRGASAAKAQLEPFGVTFTELETFAALLQLSAEAHASSKFSLPIVAQQSASANEVPGDQRAGLSTSGPPGGRGAHGFESLLEATGELASHKYSRGKKDKARPKKPRSSYIIFLDRHRNSVRSKMPNLKMKEITAELAKLWRTVTPEEREICRQIAKYESERYEVNKKVFLQRAQQIGKLKPESSIVKPKAKRRKKDKEAPRKGRSAFILFLMDFRNANKQADNSMEAFSSLSKQVSSAWASLSDEERQPYLDRAAKEAEEYRVAKSEYLARQAQMAQ